MTNFAPGGATGFVTPCHLRSTHKDGDRLDEPFKVIATRSTQLTEAG